MVLALKGSRSTEDLLYYSIEIEVFYLNVYKINTELLNTLKLE